MDMPSFDAARAEEKGQNYDRFVESEGGDEDDDGAVLFNQRYNNKGRSSLNRQSPSPYTTDALTEYDEEEEGQNYDDYVTNDGEEYRWSNPVPGANNNKYKLNSNNRRPRVTGEGQNYDGNDDDTVEYIADRLPPEEVEQDDDEEEDLYRPDPIRRPSASTPPPPATTSTASQRRPTSPTSPTTQSQASPQIPPAQSRPYPGSNRYTADTTYADNNSNNYSARDRRVPSPQPSSPPQTRPKDRRYDNNYDIKYDTNSYTTDRYNTPPRPPTTRNRSRNRSGPETLSPSRNRIPPTSSTTTAEERKQRQYNDWLAENLSQEEGWTDLSQEQTQLIINRRKAIVEERKNKMLYDNYNSNNIYDEVNAEAWFHDLDDEEEEGQNYDLFDEEQEDGFYEEYEYSDEDLIGRRERNRARVSQRSQNYYDPVSSPPSRSERRVQPSSRSRAPSPPISSQPTSRSYNNRDPSTTDYSTATARTRAQETRRPSPKPENPSASDVAAAVADDKARDEDELIDSINEYISRAAEDSTLTPIPTSTIDSISEYTEDMFDTITTTATTTPSTPTTNKPLISSNINNRPTRRGVSYAQTATAANDEAYEQYDDEDDSEESYRRRLLREEQEAFQRAWDVSNNHII